MNDPTAKRGRRWLRFSLRSLLIAVAVLAVPLGLEVNRARNQRAVLAELEQIEGSGFNYSSRLPEYLAFLSQWRHPDWLKDFLYDVSEVGGVSSDDTMLIVAKLPNVNELSFEGIKFTDLGMERLGAMSSLRRLRLDNVQITDAGLQRLTALKNLVDLEIAAPRITDDGIRHLSGLTKLKGLRLKSKGITEGILFHLEVLPNLEILYLIETKVTPWCKEWLHRNLQNCIVFVN
jgi:hypothetical protein